MNQHGVAMLFTDRHQGITVHTRASPESRDLLNAGGIISARLHGGGCCA